MFCPDLGVGVGLRPAHYSKIQTERPRSVSWVEVISENFMAWKDHKPGRSLETLLEVRREYPISLHGVSLSIGSVDPVDLGYLQRLKDLIEQVEPIVVSDHLCWTGVGGENLHDLLPLPYTQECLRLVTHKIDKVQNYLGRPILIENPSSYLEFTSSEMSEWDFLTELLKESGCGLLLDINNVYVSSVNHGFDPKTYLRSIPKDRIGQIHLAGHSRLDGYLIDTHDEPVCTEVWNLFRWFTRTIGSFNTMIERDDNIPEWEVLEAEVQKIGEIQNEESFEAL